MTHHALIRVLVIDDSAFSRQAITRMLRASPLVEVVGVARDGEEGFSLASSGAYDLLILDVMLPGRNGYEILRDLRERGLETPELFLSARGEASDRIKAALESEELASTRHGGPRWRIV